MQHLTAIAPPEVHIVQGLLNVISDPEVPVLTITDLGMARNIEHCGDGWVIGFTPTYSGCPATEHLLGEICAVVADHGYTPVHIVLQLDLPWTTNWMSPDVRERSRQYGISSPQARAYHVGMSIDVQCLRRASIHTSLISEFGSMACKALCRYDSRRELFDYSKCIRGRNDNISFACRGQR